MDHTRRGTKPLENPDKFPARDHTDDLAPVEIIHEGHEIDRERVHDIEHVLRMIGTHAAIEPARQLPPLRIEPLRAARR